MMSTLAPPSVLSAPQRRCQVLLTLFLPGQIATTQTFSSLNGVDDATVQEDIIGAGLEIQRYHRLTIATAQNGGYAIEGTPLNQRLCLLQWLRRGLRICPAFIAQQFTPALKAELKQRGIARTLYDDTNLQALVNRCARTLNRQFDCRDVHFLRLYLQYCLLQHHLGQSPSFTHEQQRWAQAAAEFTLAEEIIRHWQRRAKCASPQSHSHRLPRFPPLQQGWLHVPSKTTKSKSGSCLHLLALQQKLHHQVAHFGKHVHAQHGWTAQGTACGNEWRDLWCGNHIANKHSGL